MNSSLAEQFKELTSNLDQKLNADEWLFAKFRESFIEPLSPAQAFTAIDEAVDLLLSQDDQHLFYECLGIIYSLSRKSDTTELPPKLKLSFNQIQNKANRYCDSGITQQMDQIKSWFKI
jgi:hypothetical protein